MDGTLSGPERDLEAVVIDIDDTVIDIGDRRVNLFRKHFPHAQGAEELRYDIGLRGIGDRASAPAKAFLADFANPKVIADLPVTPIAGAVDAVKALQAASLNIILITARSSVLRDCTLADLAAIGLDWSDKPLVMHEASSPLDPSSDVDLEKFKIESLRRITRDHEVIACVGDSSSDVAAAFSVRVPAILLHTTHARRSFEDLHRQPHVGFRECGNWAQVLVEIGTFRAGERQLGKLRDSFTEAYTSWMQNMNFLCSIDVTVASVVAALASRAVLETSLHWFSRLLAVVPLLLALVALILAVRAFTSRYSSGAEANKSIAPKFRQAIGILFDFGGPLTKARLGDAIYEYAELRDKPAFEQAGAHREFFYGRYRTNNAQALMNLRMFEMRSLNYVRAYAEHLASRTLIWAATLLAMWAIGVAFLDPAFTSRLPAPPASTSSQQQPAPAAGAKKVDPQADHSSRNTPGKK